MNSQADFDLEEYDRRMNREAERDWNAKQHRGRTLPEERAVIDQVQSPPRPSGGALAVIPATQDHPLERNPEEFAQALVVRGQNRDAFIRWIRDRLVRGVDFDRLHTVGKRECSHGNACQEPSHWSKDQLFKTGAEKICGMLAVTPTYPNLERYEQAALDGVNIQHILLKCHILSASGHVVSEGVGARSLAQDRGVLNKSLKMAKKSAHIDATLGMLGLSEVFSKPDEPPIPQSAGDEDLIIPMGQFRGKPWKDVSLKYLQGVLASAKVPGVMKDGAKQELARRDAQEFDDDIPF